VIKLSKSNEYYVFCYQCNHYKDIRPDHDETHTAKCKPQDSYDLEPEPKKLKTNHDYQKDWDEEWEEVEEETQYIKKWSVPVRSIQGVPTPVKLGPLLFVDFETCPVGYHKDTHTPEPLPEYPPVSPEMDQYPYFPTILDPQYYYRQVVNYCVLQEEDGTEFVFRTNPVEELMNHLKQPQYHNAILVAHNGGKFDWHFIMDAFLDDKILKLKKKKAPVLKGCKIITATIHNDIKLIDSYCFVNQPLKNFPKTFGLSGIGKGDFPHEFNKPQFQQYVGPMPHLDYYAPHTKKSAARQEIMEWYASQVKQGEIFNFQEQMYKYCSMDVTVLRLGMLQLKELLLNLHDAEGRFIGVDPFHFTGIASAAYDGIYRHYFLPENTITIVPKPTKANISTAEIAWLEYVMRTENIFITHALNDQNQKVLNLVNPYSGKSKRLPVDGWCEATQTVYQFQGCYFHGCPRCHSPDKQYTNRFKMIIKDGKEEKKFMSMRENHLHSLLISKMISDKYRLVEMWECEWKRKCRKEKINTRTNLLEKYSPITPRDAYFGGRVNAVKLLYECEGPEKIYYMDVTSMYPFVMADEQYFFPTGAPVILKKDRDVLVPLSELFGLAKAEVIPPNHLYFPILPERNEEEHKVFFDLNHPKVGTWTSVELQKAEQLGYQIEMFEQHHFPQKSNSLFKEYNETMFAIKRRAEEEGNSGLKSLAKMCINAPTGKWGENPANYQTNEFIESAEDFLKCWLAPQEMDITIINQNTALVSKKDHDEYSQYKKGNVYISTFITAYARLKLYEDALEPLQEKVLYFDTDSVIYVSPTGEPLLPIDTTGALGLWTSECKGDDYFTHFVSAGPKTYALKSHTGANNVAKSKGFSLHYSNSEKFHYESLKRQVLHKACKQQIELLTLHQGDVDMRRDGQFHVGFDYSKGKTLKMVYNKRRIIRPTLPLDDIRMIDTLPFGHKDLTSKKAVVLVA
jgi:hypothetical protein